MNLQLIHVICIQCRRFSLFIYLCVFFRYVFPFCSPWNDINLTIDAYDSLSEIEKNTVINSDLYNNNNTKKVIVNYFKVLFFYKRGLWWFPFYNSRLMTSCIHDTHTISYKLKKSIFVNNLIM